MSYLRPLNLFNPNTFTYPINLLDDYHHLLKTLYNPDNKIIHTYSDDSKVYYTIDIPGMTKNDIQITSSNNIIKIVGNCNNHNRNFNISTNFELNTNVDINSVNSYIENGILIISFNKIQYNNSTNEKIININ